MRNCFVPFCDNKCRNDKKRMMFLAPKDPILFERWKIILPSVKELKHTDKVCAIHFHEKDIIKTFDHIIQGKLFQMERGRPRLKADAVPCKNLVIVNRSGPTGIKRGRPVKDTKRLAIYRELGTSLGSGLNSTNVKVEKPVILPIVSTNVVEEYLMDEEVELCATDDAEEEPMGEISLQAEPADAGIHKNVTNSPEIHSHEVKTFGKEIVNSQTNSAAIETNNSEELVELDRQQKFIESYDLIYDEIFEVVLPSTLWGIHRDPEREFVAFTYLNPEKMSVTKSCTVYSDCSFKIFRIDRTDEKGIFNETLTHKILSSVLNNLDETE